MRPPLGRGAERGGWANWAGNVRTRPARRVRPHSVSELAAAVRAAARDGLRVKAVGSGHSFSPVAATDGLLVEPGGLTAVRAVDRASGTVTVESGITLQALSAALDREGLAMTNLGDVMAQTVAGAISTGTHGTGRASGSLAAQVRAVELVLADGSVVSCSAERQPELFQAARLGLGALGVVSAVTLAVEPAFLLTAVEEPMPLDRVVAEFDQLATDNEHFEFYWFPHTTGCLTKRNNRTPGPPEPLPRVRGWVDDELLSNGVFRLACGLGRAVPATVPTIAQLSSRALAARRYTDTSFRVFTSPRRVRFVESEYAVPREAAMEVLGELRRLVDRGGWRISFPVEVRLAPADDVWLSTASGRDTVYLAVHMYRGTDHRAYFAAVEELMTAYQGRPHWGKMHGRDAAYLAGVYPRFPDFVAVRDRIDPERRFGNPCLRQVLGD